MTDVTATTTEGTEDGSKTKDLDSRLEVFFRSPLDQDKHHTIRLTIDRYALFPPTTDDEAIVSFYRVDKNRKSDYFGSGFSVGDGKCFFKLYLHQFIELDNLDAFRILQATCNAILDDTDRISAGLVKNFNGSKKEYLSKYTFPATRIADSSYAIDCHWSPKQKISATDTIPEGHFVRLRRIEKPSSKSGDCPITYVPAAQQGAGFRLGVATFSKLYRNMYCLPKTGRETFQDSMLYQKEFHGGNANKLGLVGSLDISDDDDVISDNDDWFDRVIPEEEIERKSKRFDDNQFQMLLMDRIEEHKSSCCRTTNGCMTCKIDSGSIKDWDRTHRGGHLLEQFKNQLPIDVLKKLGWRKTGSEARRDESGENGETSSSSGAEATAPKITTWERIMQRKRKRESKSGDEVGSVNSTAPPVKGAGTVASTSSKQRKHHNNMD